MFWISWAITATTSSSLCFLNPLAHSSVKRCFGIRFQWLLRLDIVSGTVPEGNHSKLRCQSEHIVCVRSPNKPQPLISLAIKKCEENLFTVCTQRQGIAVKSTSALCDCK